MINVGYPAPESTPSDKPGQRIGMDAFVTNL